MFAGIIAINFIVYYKVNYYYAELAISSSIYGNDFIDHGLFVLLGLILFAKDFFYRHEESFEQS